MANVEKFKYWCNKILPLVYDDTLSYYEFLGKVYEKLNETIDAVNSNTEAVTEFDQRINDFIAAETAARESWEDQQERDRQSWETTETANRAAWENQQALKWSAFQDMFISEYDPDDAYVKGDLCSLQYKMYVAKASTTGAFDPTKWDEIVLSDYLSEYVSSAAGAMQAQYDGFLEDYQRTFGIAQNFGNSTTNAMSQSAVTDNLLNPIFDSMINFTNATADTFISPSTGLIIENQPTGVTSDYINISSYAGTNFKAYLIRSFAFYDESKTYISGVNNPSYSKTFTVPANAVYVRATALKNDITKAAFITESNYLLGGIPLNLDYFTKRNVLSARTDLDELNISNISQISYDGFYKVKQATAETLNIPIEHDGVLIRTTTGNTTPVYIAVCYKKIFSVIYPVLLYKLGWGEWQDMTAFQWGFEYIGRTALDVLSLTAPGKAYMFNLYSLPNLSNMPSEVVGGGAMFVVKYTDTILRIIITLIDGKYKIFLRNGNEESWHNFPEKDNSSNPYYGKKINWCGDSIVAGAYAENQGFDNITSNVLGMIETDYGQGSATISYNERNVRIISEWYTNMNNTADIIAVSAGTNDWYHADVPVGTISDTTTHTFYGALNVLCEGLLNKYPGKQIFFTTPIKRAQAPYAALDAVNANGKTLKEYCEIIQEVCSKYSIPVLDMYSESLLVPQLSSQSDFFAADKIHPTTAGAQIMSRRMVGWLKQLM